MAPIVTCILLGGWLFCSIVAQIPPLRWIIKIMYKWDWLALIPSWCFFAHPERSCLQLWYRDTFVDGHETSWKEVWFCDPSPLHTLWNPRRCHWKMLEHACTSLLEIEENDLEEVQLLASPSYRFTLTSILAWPHQNECKFRQFLIARTSRNGSTRKAEMLFLSPKRYW